MLGVDVEFTTALFMVLCHHLTAGLGPFLRYCLEENMK
jgi:hypothetical protein